MCVRRAVDFIDGLVPRTIFVLALTCLLIIVGGGSARADVTYVYDELGRLVGVIDPSSDTAVYSYDAVGNLLGIARYASSTVSIIDFQPKSGPIGTVVTIQGTGFSATPGNNTVTFNGVAATVTSSTATSLVVPVPAGATTGTIGVTTAAGSATSSASFTVTATSGAPTITSFSPAVGVPGATITLNGTNFDPVTINNKVSFYGLPAPRPKALVSAATTTALDTVVPLNARSGPVTLSTLGGTTVSTADFFVPVGGYTAAQTIFTGRIVVGGASVDVPMTSTNKQGLVLFDGLAGQRLNLGTVVLSGFGTPGVTVYRPDGVLLPITATNVARYLPALPMSGIYVISLANLAATHTVRLTLSEEVTATAVVGGSAVTVSLPRVGQRAQVSFQGTAGQRVDLGMTFTMSGVTAYFKTADEATTLTAMGMSSPGELHSPALPSTGTYLLVVEPGGTVTGSFTATLSEPVTGTITIDGASVPLSITRIGQRARVTFTGTAGQPLSMGLTSASVGGQVTVFSPSGATLLGPVGYSAPDASVHFPALAATGTHEILIDFSGTTTGSITVWLSQTLSATTALNGTGLFVNITRPGLRAVVTFPGTASHRASHVVTGATFAGTLILMRSDGTVTGTPGLPGTTFVEPYNLPTTSTYYMIIQPSAANTGSLTVTSYDVPADATGSLTINGGTVPVALSVPGQNAILSFAGTSGQTITTRVTGNTIGCVSLSVTKPAGGGTYNTSSCSGSFNLVVLLTTTGSHTVTIDPQGSATGAATVEVTIP
jgi:YD repeat-containing protein